MEHYQNALSTTDDRRSDRVFFRHFMLLLYDVAAPAHPIDDGGPSMWERQLDQLCEIATMRHQQPGGESYPFMIWWIFVLDTYACLCGSGRARFVQTVHRFNMLPSPETQLSPLSPTRTDAYLPDEANMLPHLLVLSQGTVMYAANVAQMAYSFRTQATEQHTGSETYAHWQARCLQAQAEMNAFWANTYPAFLPRDTPNACLNLPHRPQMVLEHVSPICLIQS